MTVDVEDYFQVQAFANHIDRASWDSHDCRVERNTEVVLALFAEAGAKGTFFTLGWVAERYPALIRRIVDEGHELASHGFEHIRADSQSPDEFRAAVRDLSTLETDDGAVPLGLTAEQTDNLVASLDTDGDGFIDYEEFLQALSPSDSMER